MMSQSLGAAEQRCESLRTQLTAQVQEERAVATAAQKSLAATLVRNLRTPPPPPHFPGAGAGQAQESLAA